MGMSRAAKMVMTNYRSRNQNNRAEGNGGEMNRSEMYGQGYGEGYRNDGSGSMEMEMRRRRDSRGRYAEDENKTEMRRGGYRNEMNEMTDAPEPGGLPAENRYQAEGRMENRMEYPKPYALPRPIGFHGSDEKQQMHKGNTEKHQGKESKELDPKTAYEWSEMLQNEDGSKGVHWTEEEVKPYMMQVRFSGNPIEFWIMMNALYSDYCKVAKRYGVDRPEFFAEMTKAWLEDKDAVQNKAAMYYECIVKH